MNFLICFILLMVICTFWRAAFRAALCIIVLVSLAGVLFYANQEGRVHPQQYCIGACD